RRSTSPTSRAPTARSSSPPTCPRTTGSRWNRRDGPVAAEGEGRPGGDPEVPPPDRPGPAPDPAIRIEDLTKSFGRREVLSGFSLDVPRRELVAVVGGSGSGKSVLLRHLAGLLRPDRGRILLEGVDLLGADSARL